jgi:hypothetical protein
MIKPYSPEIERQMKKVYDSLEVEDKRKLKTNVYTQL